MDYALELENVSKTYQKSGFTLEKITFSVPSGSIMGFVGENGAGKSTTIGCILNTLFKDSGTIKLFNREMKDEDVASSKTLILSSVKVDLDTPALKEYKNND